MKRILIRISFLGKNYYGTQKLKNLRTIQGVFEDALSNLFNQHVKVTISSRLDRKVNAFDFGLSFDSIKDDIDLNRLKFYLDNYIEDVHIKDIRFVNDEFSARYSCSGKIYTYLLQNGEYNPLFEDSSLYLKKKVDPIKLKEALELFKGEHEFKNFASFDEEEDSKLIMNNTMLSYENGLTILSFSSRNFLKYQIRFMVGTILQYAYNQISKEKIAALLNGEVDFKFQRKKVEAKGLFLYKIIYPEFDNEKLEYDKIELFKKEEYLNI